MQLKMYVSIKKKFNKYSTDNNNKIRKKYSNYYLLHFFFENIDFYMCYDME